MLIRPYGERPDDGGIQLSFTLPVAGVAMARLAAEALCSRMELKNVRVSHVEDIGGGFVFCVVHAVTSIGVETASLDGLEAVREIPTMEEIDRRVLGRLGRPLVVVGACIGADAHTVGLDAILNAKGYAGTPGLERYRAFKVINLGSQVACDELIRAVRKCEADALLVSQIVTHNDIHRRTLTELVQALDNEGLRGKLILVVGGPRIGRALAGEIGFDAGFGIGTTPAEVADCVSRLALQRAGFNE